MPSTLSSASPNTASALLNRLMARGKLRHFQVLLRLAELGSIQRTADAIGMTQPSVTQTLAYLETLLDIRLFERHARGVRPTPACVDLLPVARRLLLAVADSAEIIAARQNQGEGVVRVVASAGAINGLLISALPAFSARFASLQVQLVEAEGEDQLLAIARGEVDLVVCRKPPVIPEGWHFHPLREDRFVIVARSHHPLAAKKNVSAAQLAQHPWLLLPAGVTGRQRFDALVQEFPQAPQTYPVVTRSLPMLWSLLRNADLLTLLPLNLARPMLDSGELVIVRAGEPVAIDPIGVLQPASGMGTAAGALAAFLLAHEAAPARRASSARSGR